MITFLLAAASAALVPTEICIQAPTNFGSESSYFDYFRNPSATQRIRGVYVAAINANGHLVTDHAGWSGTTAGCVELYLYDTTDYVIGVKSVTYVNGRPIEVVDDSGIPTVSLAVDAAFTPVAPATSTYTLPSDAAWDQLVMAGWIFGRDNWGIPQGPLSETVSFVYELDGGAPLCCYHWRGELYLGNDRRMLAIAHEIGHWIQWNRNGQRTNNKDYTADFQDCNMVGNGDSFVGARPLSREHDSAAAVEGFANFVAAWAVNRRSETDCVIRDDVDASYDLDPLVSDVYEFFNRDNWQAPTELEEEERGNISCESAPHDYNANGDRDPPAEHEWEIHIDARDWLEDQHGETTNRCQQTLVGYSTAHDWTRFYWDLTTNESMTPRQIADTWAESRAYSWDARVLNGGSSNDPIRRTEAAFDALGFGAAFDAQKSNGLDHY